MNTRQHETSETSSVQEETPVPEQPALAFYSSSAEEMESLPKSFIAPTVTFDQEEKEEEKEEKEEEEEAGQEKEVKSILKTDRHAADDGYKAVWFKTDVDPEAGERVEVIEDNAAADDDDSDQDLQKNEEEEEEGSDTDNHHQGLGVSFASESSSPPAEVAVNMSYTDAGTEDSEL